MLNIDFGTTQDIMVLFIVVILLGAIVINYWVERAHKAQQRRLRQEKTEQSEKPEEPRRAA